MKISKKRLIIILVVAAIFFSVIAISNFYAALKQRMPDLLSRFQNTSAPSTAPAASAPSETVLYKPVIDYEQAVITAVDKASKAVVSIVISKDLPVIEQCPYNPFANLPPEFRQFFGEEFNFSQPCQKGTRRQEIGGGSGFVISQEGLIVSNKHVVSDTQASYTILTNDGGKYEAEILARHPSLDLAILKIKKPSGKNLAVVRLGDSDSVKLGQTAIVIGNALGEFRNTVATGVISGLARTVTAQGGGIMETIEGVIQTDAAINQGNSGGPLLNLKGEVIGINTAMVVGAQNIGFAIPINQVKKAIESVQTSGKIVVPFLGVRFLKITPELAKKEKLSVENGALLRGNEEGPAVLPNSPAQKAGLQAEDIILEINNEQINQEHSLVVILQKYIVGDKIKLKVLREEKEINLEVVLEEKPNS